MHGHRETGSLKRLLVICIGVASVAAACGSTQQSNAPASAGQSLGPPSAAPSSSSPLEPIEPSATPSPTAAPSGTPPGGAVSGWSAPQRIVGGDCAIVSATIDENGTAHVATACNGSIHYAHSDSGRWTVAILDHPTDRIDQGPQLAFDGDVLYLAWTRIKVTDGGCGDSGLRDVGIYVRHRKRPDGAWSAAERIGSPTDGLQNLRVAGGTIHMTISDRSTDRVYYETARAGDVARYSVPGAVGGTSLRIGADGLARIAYEASRNLQFGVFDGSGFSHSGIPGSKNSWGPSLVLDAQNHAHVLWTRSYHGEGCADAGPDPEEGTYYGTDASGTWTFRRISTSVGDGSLTLDPAGGRVYVAISGERGIRYLTKLGSGGWHQTRVTQEGWSPIIRVSPKDGRVTIVYLGESGGIYAVTGS
jgi:hypothetical protein